MCWGSKPPIISIWVGDVVNSTQRAEALEAIHSVRQDPGPLLPVLGQVRLGWFGQGEVRDVMGEFSRRFLGSQKSVWKFRIKVSGSHKSRLGNFRFKNCCVFFGVVDP